MSECNPGGVQHLIVVAGDVLHREDGDSWCWCLVRSEHDICLFSRRSANITGALLMYQLRFAGGSVAREMQVRFSSSSILSRLSGLPSTVGPSLGSTTTSRSAKAVSVAKMGPSSLTSHRNLPVVA